MVWPEQGTTLEVSGLWPLHHTATPGGYMHEEAIIAVDLLVLVLVVVTAIAVGTIWRP